MPLLVTPSEPFVSGANLPVASVYAIITEVSYQTKARVILFRIGYFASEAAYDAQADDVNISPALLPRFITQAATAEEANAVPIFKFLETILTAALCARLPEGTRIEDAPPAPPEPEAQEAATA